MQTQWSDNKKSECEYQSGKQSESGLALVEAECISERKYLVKLFFYSCQLSFLKKTWLFLFLFSFSLNSYCQEDSTTTRSFHHTSDPLPIPFNKTKLKRLIIGESITYASVMTGAYFLWYKNSLSGEFNFFDDSKEWLLMDKFGHFSSGYVVASASAKAYEWTGIPKWKSDRIGTLQSILFLTSLEVFDGFSSGYGFSWADMGFNILGAGTYFINQRFGEKIHIQPKFSYGRSEMANYRPNLLGENGVQQIVKDYNGQTYWFSFRLKKLELNIKENLFSPFNISFGYGAQGMTGGHENVSINEQGLAVPDFQRFRQYYLSFDIDLRQIPCKNKALKKVLSTLNVLKFPFPALELSRGKVFMNWTSYGR
jgi:uncharacterized protein YfiM (DUF2279 family)